MSRRKFTTPYRLIFKIFLTFQFKFGKYFYMNPLEIKAELIKRGIKQIEIAKKLKVTPTAVSQVIYGIRNYPIIREEIAKILNKKIEELWEDDYI